MANMMSQAIRPSGIYGLFNLDGAPVEARDTELLGLPRTTEARSWLVAGHDPRLPFAVSDNESPLGFTVLVGEVEEAGTLAASLGLPNNSSPAALAEAALMRFGGELPSVLIGEWSLLHRASNGTLTLMLSAAKRDRLHYTIRGNRVAVASNLFALAGLDWVNNTVDEAGLLFPMGRAAVRAGRGDSTMLKSVYQLSAGSTAIIQLDGSVTKTTAHTLVEQPRWHGSYADAVVETKALMRHIMRTKLARHSKVASMLSGGLDSSLLTWLCSESGTDLLALTSVSPPDSGIADEAHFADSVARTLGIASQHVFPDFDNNIYRPKDAILTGGSGPILSNRHCLTDTFQSAARAAGATLIVDGTYGEMSITARLPKPSPLRQLRTFARHMLSANPFVQRSTVETTPFHVRLAPHRLAKLPEQILAACSDVSVSAVSMNPNGLFGYMKGSEKALTLQNEFYPGAIRVTHPYRDIRLLRLFAGFPIQMLTENGADRGIGRAMMDGHLPDMIRLRNSGMPASPDHLPRLKRQASAARQRIPLFRKAELDDWLDLDWLDLALESVAARGPTNHSEANEVQLTAIAAEFLLWWRSQN